MSTRASQSSKRVVGESQEGGRDRESHCQLSEPQEQKRESEQSPKREPQGRFIKSATRESQESERLKRASHVTGSLKGVSRKRERESLKRVSRESQERVSRASLKRESYERVSTRGRESLKRERERARARQRVSHEGERERVFKRERVSTRERESRKTERAGESQESLRGRVSGSAGE